LEDNNHTTSGKQYMLSAIRRKHLDRIPTTVLIGPYCAKLAGHSVRDILQDAQKSAQAHLAFYDLFHPDSLIVYNDIYLELEAVGCELEFPENAIAHPKKALLENKKNLAGLKIPDPRKDGRLPYFLELCDRVAEQVRQEASVGLGHSGPWNLAMHLRGAEQFLMDSIEDPGFVHELMTFTTEVVKTLGDTLIDQGFMPSLEKAVAAAAGKVVIMGNVPTHLFADGTLTDMESAIDACVQTAGGECGYVLASGCEIPMNSTENRITHFFEYSHKAGRQFLEGVDSRGQGAE